MAKPRLLDLFGCAGGAARGYQLAGFHVTSIDKDPQPRNPADVVHQRNVMDLGVDYFAGFDAIHASPPCQFGTALRHAPRTKKDHLNLIPPIRDRLKRSGRPFIIENVEAVRGHLINPIRLCGSMFGLGSAGYHLERHRLFESNVAIAAPGACRHQKPVIGIYGAHARCRAASAGGRGTRDFVGLDKPAMAREAMGMPWATLAQMSEAIPPAYTRHLGLQLIDHLRAVRGDSLERIP